MALISIGAIQPNVVTLSTGKSTRAANRSRGSAEEAPSRSEQKWFDNARHALTTNANSDHALSAALASPHGLRQNDRC
jgi:hypothetical protein